jgi:threo-3-hydroxy-L-aspartate ammonia-lyase
VVVEDKTIVDFDDIVAAVNRLKGVANKTPVMTSRNLSELCGVQVYLKCENFQRVGAFKFRGAYNCIAKRLSNNPELQQKGIVAISSGNHSQGVALAAKLLGVPVTIYLPKDAPPSKIEATAGYGANLEFFDREKDDRDELAARLIEQGVTLIHGYDDPDIIAGQGTAALELMHEIPDLDLIMTPLGGGGLLSGSMIAARAYNPKIKVYGVEPELANDWDLSIKAGKRMSIPAPQTIADGVSLCTPGKLPFEILKDQMDGVILISEAEILEALSYVIERMKIIIEPSSALVVAALMKGKVPLAGISKAGLIISGGNIDPKLLSELYS